MKTHKFIKNSRGFSLIEVLVVIAIVGTLAAIGYSTALKINKNSKIEKNREIIEALELAIDRFYQEYKQLPSSASSNDSEMVSTDTDFEALLIELEGDTKNNGSNISINVKGINFLENVPEASDTGVGGIVRVNGTVKEIKNAFRAPIYLTLDFNYDNTIDTSDTSFQSPEVGTVKGRRSLIWTTGPDDDSGTDERVKNW